MEFEEAFGIVDKAVFDKQAIHLNDVQRVILLGTWERQKYHEIAEKYKYCHDYLQNDAGAKLWKILSEALGEKVNKRNFKTVVERQAQTIGSLQIQQREGHDETILNKPTVTNSIESDTAPKSSIEPISFLEYFSKSIDQLKSQEMDVRIRAISILRILAKCSQSAEHWTIMESLAAFIRNNAPRKKEEEGEEKRFLKRFPKDTQAALNVIVQRDLNQNEGVLDLSNTDLRGAKFSKPNLHRVNLTGANLKGVMLIGAIMCRASLRGANLQKAFLRSADLQWANLFSANLQGTHFNNANLEGADLRHTKLQEANFFKAKLQKAYLRGVDLTGVKNLQFKQIALADGDSTTRRPENLRLPVRWMKANPRTGRGSLIRAAIEYKAMASFYLESDSKRST